MLAATVMIMFTEVDMLNLEDSEILKQHLDKHIDELKELNK
jgi:hypothetical protein